MEGETRACAAVKGTQIMVRTEFFLLHTSCNHVLLGPYQKRAIATHKQSFEAGSGHVVDGLYDPPLSLTLLCDGLLPCVSFGCSRLKTYSTMLRRGGRPSVVLPRSMRVSWMWCRDSPYTITTCPSPARRWAPCSSTGQPIPFWSSGRMLEVAADLFRGFEPSWASQVWRASSV